MNKIQLLSLKNNRAFELASKSAVRYSCRYFTIFVSKIPEDSNKYTNKDIAQNSKPIFYGFKVSKKYGKAAERNLLKRRIKSAIYSNFSENYYGFSVIFIPKKLISELDYHEIEDQLIRGINWCRRRIDGEAI